MMEKYYDPEIEEFYVGFECEVNMPYIGYIPIRFGIDKIIHPELDQFKDELDKIAHAIVRVKYLDKEDLEDIGFIIEEEEIKPYGHYLKGKFKNNTELWYAKRQNNEKIYVSLKSKRYNGNIRVRIKNKCDLVRIMKQSEML